MRNRGKAKGDGKRGGELADEKDKTQGEDQREDCEFGVVGESSSVPAVEVFRQRSKKRGERYEQYAELDQPLHNLNA